MTHNWQKPFSKFVAAMQTKMAENQHKGGWEHNHYEDLIDRLHQEIDELIIAIATGKSKKEVTAEAADVANFCMMIADTYEAGEE